MLELPIELTEEQYERFFEKFIELLMTGEMTSKSPYAEDDEWWIEKYLPDIYQIIRKALKEEAQLKWGEEVLPQLYNVDIYSPEEFYNAYLDLVEEQGNAIRKLLNNYLTAPLSLEDTLRLLSEESRKGGFPAIKSRKKRYVIAIINTLAEAIEDPVGHPASDIRLHRLSTSELIFFGRNRPRLSGTHGKKMPLATNIISSWTR